MQEAWDELLAINLRSAFNCTKAAVPHLKARGAGGRSSTSPRSPARTSRSGRTFPTPSRSGGMVGFTRHLAYELAPWRIRANAVFPGTTRTRLLGGGDDSPGGAQEQMAKGVTPLGRLIEPEEIANAILFFLSPRAATVHRGGARGRRRHPPRLRPGLRGLLPEPGRGAARSLSRRKRGRSGFPVSHPARSTAPENPLRPHFRERAGKGHE